MPTNLSFAEAASLPLAAITAVQALRKYEGDLAGKTVFVPAGLGGTGAFACQLAKNVFKAGKVITTVSTAKVGRVAELLGEGVVDQSKLQSVMGLKVDCMRVPGFVSRTAEDNQAHDIPASCSEG